MNMLFSCFFCLLKLAMFAAIVCYSALLLLSILKLQYFPVHFSAAHKRQQTTLSS